MKNHAFISCNKTCVFALFLAFFLSIFVAVSSPAHACQFLIPDASGNAAQGPSLDTIADGFTQGLLDCGGESHRMVVMTINVDTSQDHIGVRDDPLFSSDVIGELKTVDNITVSPTSKVHILGRVNQSPRIGVRRGFVHFATLCNENQLLAPLDCSWGTSRIKFRTTIIDTDADEVVDRSYHELSIYQKNGRLHMVTFWTPHRDHIRHTTADWINALHAFGVDIVNKSG